MKLVFFPLLMLLAGGAGDFKNLLHRINTEKDAEKRRVLVERLAAEETLTAAHALARIVRLDPSVEVRVSAATGLARSRSDEATRLLLNLVPAGGVRAVRVAVGRALGRRKEAAIRIAEGLAHPKATALTCGLLIEALGRVPGPEALVRLLKLAIGEDPFLRCEALRALARRTDGTDELVSLLGVIAAKYRDIGTAMTVLDLLENRPDVRHGETVDSLRKHPAPSVAEAAEHVTLRFRYEREAAAARKLAEAAKKDGYEFAPREPPVPPPPRPRFDLVFGFDSTGSVAVHLASIATRIRDQYRYFLTNGCDVRIGVVAFRDERTSGKYPPLTILPLTHDLSVVRAFLASVRAGGADSQGAAVSFGLNQALNRMGWRDRASRSVTLIADSRLDDPPKCYRMTRLHRDADGVRVKVFYLLRTRKKIPEDIVKLAKVGGGTLELLD